MDKILLRALNTSKYDTSILIFEFRFKYNGRRVVSIYVVMGNDLIDLIEHCRVSTILRLNTGLNNLKKYQ